MNDTDGMLQYTEIEEEVFALLKETDHEKRRNQVADLWKRIAATRHMPVSVENRALFVYYGKANKVELVGDWSFWQPASFLQRVEHTDLFYAILQFPRDARLQYKLIVDGAWTNDPVNERVQAEGFGLNSEFWMPEYKDESMLELQHDVAHGKIERLALRSSLLRSNREVFLYTPPASVLAHHHTLPLLLVHDGAEALRLGRFQIILDNLISENKIKPLVAMFISPQMRNDEYATSDDYIRFTVEEALPFAEAEFSRRGIHISKRAHHVCVTGASLGGLLATRTALRHPQKIGSVIAQSPSYWWNRGEIFRSDDMKNAGSVNFVIQTGTICDAKDLASMMVQRLRNLGSQVQYFEHSQGHTWGNWRTTFAEAVRAWMDPKHAHHALST